MLAMIIVNRRLLELEFDRVGGRFIRRIEKCHLGQLIWS